jgi:hypothetical protein
MDVVDRIRAAPTHVVMVAGRPMKDVPVEDVVIKSIRRVESKEMETK